jgi:hypothetical protein
MTDISNYAALFYKNKNVVGVSTFDSTKEEARNIVNLLSSAYGDYLPNRGDYDGVSFIETNSIDSIFDGAISSITTMNDKEK